MASPYQILLLANLTERLNSADTDLEREHLMDYISLIRRVIEHRTLRVEKENNKNFILNKNKFNNDLNHIVFSELNRRAVERREYV